jgi:cupin fold WbuC family metalloprotein
MQRIDQRLINQVSAEAGMAARKRKNYNFHTEENDPLQRMLNALEPGTYIVPHRHVNPAKREAFIILKGRVLFIEFDDTGHITDHCILDSATGNFGAEIHPGSYHTLIALEEGSVIYEIKDGPYHAKTDKEFAPWAPPEQHTEAAASYLQQLLGELGMAN